MKQLISRIGDDLHRRLKERAAQEGRFVNDLVAEVLAAAVMDGRESFGRRPKLSGLRVLPPAPMHRPPSLDDVLEANRGSGTAVSDAYRPSATPSALNSVRRPAPASRTSGCSGPSRAPTPTNGDTELHDHTPNPAVIDATRRTRATRR